MEKHRQAMLTGFLPDHEGPLRFIETEEERKRLLRREMKEKKIVQIDVPFKAERLENWKRAFWRFEVYEPVTGLSDLSKGVVELSICTEGWKGPEEKRPPNDFGGPYWTGHDYDPSDVMFAAAIQMLVTNPLLTPKDIAGRLAARLEKWLGYVKKHGTRGVYRDGTCKVKLLKPIMVGGRVLT